jgi:signal transduction histidine kinase
MGRAEKEMCLPFIIDRLKSAVNELRDSNDRLASTQEALLQSEKLASMGQLAAGVAHEVNNPLGIVLMYSHMLLDEADKASPVYGDLSMIAEQANRCKRIVAGLLDFARENRVLLQPCDVRHLVNRAVLSVPAPGTVEISLRFDLRNPVCELDEDQMIQVLTNLISNAFDAMPQGGRLLIHLLEAGENMIITVTDTGVGIADENMGKLFEPFFTTKKMGKGTGLGLPVSYGIVKMHRGDITVKSNADPAKGPTGTSFTITVPRHGKKD